MDARTTSNRRRLRLAAAALLLLTGAGAAAAGAAATDELPDGWSRSGDTLTWTAPQRIRPGDARIEIRAGDRVLQPVTVDGNRVSVDGTGLAGTELDALQVSAAGRRLDRTAAAQAVANAAIGTGDLLAEARSYPALATDPGTKGAYATASGEYALEDLRIAGLAAPVPVRALVVGPTNAPGPRPVVLFLHGRHTSCFSPGGEDGSAWPCPAGWSPVPSYRGYVQPQELLASQGYVTVSVAANGIDGQDGLLADTGTAARAALVEAHLRAWAGWSASDAGHAAAPAAVARVARADLSRLLLVGHSRGGEGVNRVALDATAPAAAPEPSGSWTVRGIVHLAPAAYGRNPTPGVPVVVLLPGCDGDVYDLEGQEYVDAARDLAGPGADPVLRSSVQLIGANHNWFNSEWTPGSATAPAWDDWGNDTDPVCAAQHSGNARISAAAQRQVASTYLAAAASVLLDGGTAALPLLDGSQVRAASAGSVGVVTHALGGRRTPVLLPSATTAVAGSGGVTATLCRQFDGAGATSACTPFDGPAGPHFLPFPWSLDDPCRLMVGATWTAPGGTATVTLPAGASLTGATALELRLASRAGLDGTATVGVAVTDADGATADLGDVDLFGLEQERSPGSLQAREVRLPLAGVRGVDLDRIAAVRLTARSATGRVWLVDAWAWSAGPSGATPPRTARVDAADLTVAEGSTARTVHVPLTVTGASGTGSSGGGQVWAAVLDAHGRQQGTGRLLPVPAGTTTLDVPVQVDADTADNPDARYQVLLKGVRGVAVGAYIGVLTVTDDD